jgi:tetratricopeptide (TPR) repeat protein
VDDAVAAFERASELEPVQGHRSLAQLYEREGQMDKAIAHYLAAADVADGRTKAGLLEKASQIYEAQGQLDMAVAHYLTAAQATVDSGTMRALYGRVADMYLAAGNPEAARSLIRSVLWIAPRNAGSWSLALDVYPALIGWYEAQGKMTEARAMAWELLAIAPRHEGALQVLTCYDFIANFGTAKVEAPEEPFPHVRLTQFTMPSTGGQRTVLFMFPEARVSYRLQVPSEPSVLRFGLAVNPETWGLGGDGSTFEVHLTDEGGAYRLLFSEHIGNDPKGQRWHDREVSLAPYAGQEVTITFVTRPGPGGDFTGDEAGWATPRVMWARAEEDFWDYPEEEISVADTLKTSPQLFTTLYPLD